MLTTTVKRLLAVTKGTLVRGGEGTVINGLAIDSRGVDHGAVFVAFAGEHTDGHDHIVEALAAGARAVIVTRSDDAVIERFVSGARPDSSLVVVDDALAAVQALAAYHRARLDCPVVAVTGSTGKTTTKDMLASVLSTRMDVASTVENRNNELGVPLTLLAAPVTADAVVVEMAMRGLGQIAELCRVAAPDLGLVTNVGETHIEVVGSRRAIADAKAELVEALPASGRAFLNGDDAWSELLAERSSAPVTYYGLSERCDVRAVEIETDENGYPSFSLVAPAGTATVRLTVPGRHNAYNAAAAAAVGLHLGLGLADVVMGLECATGSPMRMETFMTAGGVHVVNDAYNASPVSMRAALAALCDMVADERRVAILGDMAELGSLTELAHFELGERIADMDLDLLIAIGPRARRIAEGARAAGMERDRALAVETREEGIEIARERIGRGDVVLVKASRVMGLEAVVEAIA